MMMEGLKNRISRLAECFIICLIILIRSTFAQTGFVSIACCADSSFSDGNISWVPDDNWFPDKTSCRSITRPVVNYKAYGKVRDFNIDSGKRCYNFTTNKDQEYLIRGTFLYGDREGTPLGSSFNVWIGVTPLSVVNSSEDSVVEGIFRAVDDQTDFCLVKDKGNPYISQLELRPLNEPEYLHGQNSSVLKVVGRFDLGRSDKENSFRYPDDPYDRIWSPKLNPEQTTHSISSNTTISNNASTVTVPLQVLQTALNTSLDHLTFLHTDLDSGDYNYTINLYFLELQDSVKNSSQRVFDIYINNEKKQNKFDILAGGSNYAKVVLNVTANGHLNLTLVKVLNGSEFGPICNAYEILQEHAWVQESDKEDVNVIGKVRDDLKMDNKEKKVWESWSGDPCLPIPWEGLTCNSINGSTVITELNLPSRKLQGVLPISVTELVHLEKLNLSYNEFTNVIPEFLSFSMLRSVDLSHNDFTGRLPDSLILLPHLKTLNFGCNPHLDIPSTFNISRLTTDGGTCSSQGSTHKGIIIGSVACGSILFTIAVGAVLFCFYKRKFMARRTLDVQNLICLVFHIF
ncbi:nodulation receptor kinase-like [Pistacia vera]|uniref:nodulation receptor kinase-like n=1 Tax=Pistacia vera TaxID=55513 RepID=UPI001263CD2A|nr:nodulation receptor kinase-like [Pistacia vera]